MPEDHEKIQETVDAMDRRDLNAQAPRLEMHRMKSGNPSDLVPVLQGLFRLHPEVQLSIDRKNDAIVAFCSPAQHETIRALVDQVEEGTKADSAVTLKIHALGDNDSYATMRTLTALLERQGTKAEISIEPRSNSLVAIARPDAHKAVQDALAQLQTEERTLEILQLDVLDPMTADMAIQRLFSDGSFFGQGHLPVVDIETSTQQLFVRATREQHTKIRDLLVKMGETRLGIAANGDASRSRVIQFSGDLQAAIADINKVWPKLRANPIRVVAPAAAPSATGAKQTGQVGKVNGSPARAPLQPAQGPKDLPPGIVPRNEVFAPLPAASAPGAASDEWRSSRAAASTAPDAKTDAWRAHRGDQPDAKETPVVIVPGDGSLTISSDDPEALNQIEQLLRSYSQERGTIGAITASIRSRTRMPRRSPRCYRTSSAACQVPMVLTDR